MPRVSLKRDGNRDEIVEVNLDSTLKNELENIYKDHVVPTDGFSGCLLLKDDNDRLSEWLAYHWLVLPLKYLVVAVDPTGTTSPKHILELWNTSDMGMEIILWDDVDYNHWIDEELDELHKHRDRQKHFLAECQKYHKRKNRTWVALIDPDEFITYNIIADDDRDLETKPNIDVFDNIDPMFTTSEYKSNMYAIRQTLVKPYIQRQTMYNFINEHTNQEPWKSEVCHIMPRVFFSAVESVPDILEDAKVEQYGLNIAKFSTLSYFKHGEKGEYFNNHFGKVIIDLSRVDANEITRRMDNIHRPLPDPICTYPFKLYETGIFRVHHYHGTWAQYSSRSDVRRSRERYDKFAYVNFGTDYQLQSWLNQFVSIVGAEKSKSLLQYAGIIDKGEKPINETAAYIKVIPPN